MTQPDKSPEEAPREEPSRRAPRPHRPGDLPALPFPAGDWNDPAGRLDELYRWADDGAVRTVDWYLHDRCRKRVWSRSLRVAAAVLGTAGAALPLLGLSLARDGLTRWGFLALLLAAACPAVDRVLGLTSGWMRDVATAQAVHRRLEALRFDWAAEGVREVLGPAEGTAAEAADRCLGVLRHFCDDVGDLVRAETAEWMVRFGPHAAAGILHGRAPAFLAPYPPPRPPLPRLPPPPTRPTMPRQRPPEGPR